MRTESTISAPGGDLLDVISDWIAVGRRKNLPVGGDVSEALAAANELRRRVRAAEPVELDFQYQEVAADTLHAVCRLLSDECLELPRSVLEDARSIQGLLEDCLWSEDYLEERESLLLSLAFVAWRAARLLGFSCEAQHWESEYKKMFRRSLLWSVAENVWASAGWLNPPANHMLSRDPEAIFQVLLYLQDHGEANPQAVSESATRIYRSLQMDRLRLPNDLHSFFLGESARLTGSVLRMVGNPALVEEWADLAEEHFGSDSNPRPSLARVAFLRLTLLYEKSQWDLVPKAARALDSSFSDLGMEEDRVKCRILWAASLKLVGRFREALEVLEPLRRSKGGIRPGLYGWVLLQSGDLHQLCGEYSRALEEFAEADRLLREGKQFTGLADVNSMLSCVYRSHGMLSEALQLLKSSCEEHAQLGMKSLEASNRMLIAETYLAMGRPREAESEIRAALPVLEEQSMVADAVAAVNILREAIRQQKAGPKAISDIRERLRSKN